MSCISGMFRLKSLLVGIQLLSLIKADLKYYPNAVQHSVSLSILSFPFIYIFFRDLNTIFDFVT